MKHMKLIAFFTFYTLLSTTIAASEFGFDPTDFDAIIAAEIENTMGLASLQYDAPPTSPTFSVSSTEETLPLTPRPQSPIEPQPATLFAPLSPQSPKTNNPHSTMFPTLTSWCQACLDTAPNIKDATGNESLLNEFFAESAFGFLEHGRRSVNKYTDQGKHQQKLAWKEFQSIMNAWLEQRCAALNDKSLWFDNYMLVPDYYDHTKKPDMFQTFTQKIVVPSETKFYIRGDLHGDIRSVIQQLQQLKRDQIIDDYFKIITPNTYIMFLGDYVDRGNYGCEVIYTLLRLSLANPDHVVLIRGNHEDAIVSAKYGFSHEVNCKFNDPHGEKHIQISRIYDALPCAVYIGCKNTATNVTNFAQCCHGGIEIGYDPKDLLDSESTLLYECVDILDRATFIKNNHIIIELPRYSTLNPKLFQQNDIILTCPHDCTSHTALGFMWNDFAVSNDNLSPSSAYHPIVIGGSTRAFEFGNHATKSILKLQSSQKSKIVTIFRAHQHTPAPEEPLMQFLTKFHGVFSMWDSNDNKIDIGSVYTFNVGADSVYNVSRNIDGTLQNFNNAYACVTLRSKLNDWTLQRINLDKQGNLLDLSQQQPKQSSLPIAIAKTATPTSKDYSTLKRVLKQNVSEVSDVSEVPKHTDFSEVSYDEDFDFEDAQKL